MSEDGLIRLEGVNKEYPMGEVTVHALRGLDLTIDAREFVVVLGPSGSGKTTMLNLIGGLDRPSAGRVLVQGDDVAQFDESRLTGYRRDAVGFIFQFFNLIPTLTASENVALALGLTERDRGTLWRRTRELLTLVDLADRANHFPSQLSGGEQQRVAIARALANGPPILLCDEPTGNLDVDMGRQVLQAIREANLSQGATVLLVSHNTSIAPIADRVVRLRDGTIDRIESNPQPVSVSEVTW
ncbi:MAG: ABC transporter ATP-binding protein [Anaerolineae bacterium]